MTDWDPADPALEKPGPHEISGVMRWHRAKVPSELIMKLLRLRGTQLIATLEKAKKEEVEATRRGLDIHDALIPKGAYED